MFIKNKIRNEKTKMKKEPKEHEKMEIKINLFFLFLLFWSLKSECNTMFCIKKSPLLQSFLWWLYSRKYYKMYYLFRYCFCCFFAVRVACFCFCFWFLQTLTRAEKRGSCYFRARLQIDLGTRHGQCGRGGSSGWCSAHGEARVSC